MRGGRAGRVGLAAIPRGYGLGLAGAAIFGLGGLCDMLWHLIFGIEQGLDALLSPSHLALVAGATLILSSPFRSAWASADPAGDAPRLRTFLPALLSLAAAVGVASFINAYLWAFLDGYHTRGLTNFYAGRADARWLLNLSRELGLAEILLTNALLLAPALLAILRWRLPFGSVTILFTFVVGLLSALETFEQGEMIVVALAAGLAADSLIRGLRPGPGRAGATRLFAAVVPLTLWSLFFLVSYLRRGIGWSAELWIGAIVMAGLSGLVLSLLAVPPALPAHRRDRG